MSFHSVFGVVLGIGAILIGNWLEGGHVTSLLQGTAALIVFGGTAGAVLLANRRQDVLRGLSLSRKAFHSDDEGLSQIVAKQIVEAAQVARRESILALEARLPQMATHQMRNVFRYLIDGIDPAVLKEIFRAEAALEERRQLAGAKIWQDAGGYAPTIGIIGAVLGLIHVMANLSDTSALGQGIAVAFVATVYGVGSANLIFIPLANRISRQIRQETLLKQMVVDGAVAIVTGLSPYVIEEKLRGYMDHGTTKI